MTFFLAIYPKKTCTFLPEISHFQGEFLTFFSHSPQNNLSLANFSNTDIQTILSSFSFLGTPYLRVPTQKALRVTLIHEFICFYSETAKSWSNNRKIAARITDNFLGNFTNFS